MDSSNWYALQVYTGKEKWVTAALQERGNEALLLLYTVVQQWSDRRMPVDRAVFPGYVFCRFDVRRRASILASPGVLRIVSLGRTPAPLEPGEIASLLRIADTGCSVAPVPFFKGGQWVAIRGGSLDGVTGRVASIRKGLRVVVSISLLERAVSLEVDATRLEPLSAKSPRPNIPLEPLALEGSLGAGIEQFLPVKRYNPLGAPITSSGNQAFSLGAANAQRIA